MNSDYYSGSNGEQLISFLENMSFPRGSVVKYVVRAGRKPGEDELKDLKKARDYLDREITRLESMTTLTAGNGVKIRV
jgi:hypothetical protein